MDAEEHQKLERAVEPSDHNSDVTLPGGEATPGATPLEAGRRNTTRNINSHNPGAAKCVCWILAYVAAFAVPAVLLAWLLPSRYAPWIALTALFLFFAVTSFYFGMQWDMPELTEEGRRFVKQLPFTALPWELPAIPKEGRKFLKWLPPLIVFVPTLVEVVDVIRNGGFTAMLVFLVFFAAAVYPPFFLGRFIARRRRTPQAGTQTLRLSRQPRIVANSDSAHEMRG